VCGLYGVLRGGTGQAERAIFVIDTAGIIRYVDIHDIARQPPTEPILKALDQLK